MSSLLESPEHVLSTLERDGSRRWLNPRVSPGRFWRARRIVGMLLIALFVLLPHWRVGGRQAVLLDVLHREFTFFGLTFLPTDTLLLALLMVSVFLTVFLATAVLGRVWCGWGCPQTVYLEFVYRPLERFFDGPTGAPRQPVALWKVARYATYLVISAFLAHTFLAYFVGVDRLRLWLTQSPFEHLGPFLVMAVTTGLMMFDFCYFREQLCLVACPYGRFQSVLLDRKSLIVAYDKTRGEPRGKHSAALPILPQDRKGDCIDCGLCVRTCPTGIDIRNGLQMECVQCTQCIDACDEIMDRVHTPRGLIRYASQDEIEGKPVSRWRPRLVAYPLLLTLSIGTLVSLIATRAPADVSLLRSIGLPYMVTAEGRVQNGVKLKFVNRTDQPLSFTVTAEAPADLLTLDAGGHAVQIDPGQSVTQPLLITAHRQMFTRGQASVTLVVRSATGWERKLPCHLLGP
jgi:cytochrome c oxidase accessory protein FixG